MSEVSWRSSMRGFWEVAPPGWEGFRIVGRAEVVDGEPRVTALHIDPRPGAAPEGLTSSRLRGLPLAEIATAAVRGSTLTVDLETGEIEHPAEVEAALHRIAQRPAAKHDSRAVTTVETVADMWNLAYDAGLPPRKTLCRVLGIESRTADRYIRRAREVGLIDPGKGRRQADSPPAADSGQDDRKEKK